MQTVEQNLIKSSFDDDMMGCREGILPRKGMIDKSSGHMCRHTELMIGNNKYKQ